ncbi:MAG TPA: hypothetical protein VJ867_06945 [Gemmatimonadaceae bacterium]|nr:hypothetical protein [Gemmatimonadaceae bacterium]
MTIAVIDGCKIEEKPRPSLRGVYLGVAGGVGSVPGSELNSFIPCGSDSIYWVEGRGKSGLQTRYGQIAHRQFQPVYVEANGAVSPPNGQAVMEGHSGNMRIDTVFTVTTQVPVECRPKVQPE